MSELNDKKFELLIDEIKKEKREKCGSISSDDYGDLDLQGNMLSNQERKKIKQELKVKRRAVKRSQKQEVDKHIKDVLNDMYGK
jgi:hypothetical protein